MNHKVNALNQQPLDNNNGNDHETPVAVHRENMTDELIKYIKENLLVGQTNIEVQPEDDLLSSGLVDSIGMMKLIGFIESHFQFTVPPQDMTIENFMTVAAISVYLQAQNIK